MARCPERRKERPLRHIQESLGGQAIPDGTEYGTLALGSTQQTQSIILGFI